MDSRLIQHARILVHYCIQATPKQTVGLYASTTAEPLVLAVHDELLRAGAFPCLVMAPDKIQTSYFKLGHPHHFDSLPNYRLHIAQSCDSSIRIRAETNTREMSTVDPDRQARLRKTLKPIADCMLARPWVLTLHPTPACAQDAEMSCAEFEDFLYAAIFADQDDPIAAWRAFGLRQQRLIEQLHGAADVHIVAPGTDLTFSIAGRSFANSDGKRNMPSGEIFTGPVENSANGFIEYDFPATRDGREVDGIRLEFRNGLVVEASARKNAAYLDAMLNLDAGARRLGEFGIGTNDQITAFTRNGLLDEKIGGTIHLALGNSYPETGGVNQSAIHWDMIKDLRKGGCVYINNKPFIRDGVFVPGFSIH